MLKKIALFTFLLSLLPHLTTAQHRGDNLSFQGLPIQTDIGVKSMAMGGAATSIGGDISSLFYNPAGTADITEFQFSIGTSSYSKLWRENQVYRPNRMFWTMAFYLEGLYVPDPANNGVWDYELAKDSAYVVNEPELGLEPYGAEAADWEKKNDGFGLNNAAIAYPFQISGRKMVVSAAYSRNAIIDFDRNDTYLDPHIGYDAYGVMERVVTDTLRFSWSRFKRERSGTVENITAGLAYDLNSKLKLGASFTYTKGRSDDYQSLERVGYFDIAKDNRFRFSYDTLDVYIEGESEFKSMQYNFGAIVKLDRVSLGISVNLPYTMTRDWSYSTVQNDTSGSQSRAMSSEDKFSVPARYAFGASITPVDAFTISFDYQLARYSQAEFTPGVPDSSLRNWVDQDELRAGLEYRPFKFLSLLAGYRYISDIFIPDGAAIKSRGPAATSYTLGASIAMFGVGRLDIAYDMRRLKYYDSYFSNTNYAYESLDNILVGYTILF